MNLLKGSIFKPFRRSKPRFDPGKVVWRDDKLAGWFAEETSELAPGFPVRADDTVIDVGCGEGTMARFAGSQGAAVIVTDVSQACVDQSVRRLQRTKARSVTGHVSNSRPLPVPSEFCTRIICLEVLEHVDAPEAVLAELVRVAKPNSLFLLSVPDPSSEAIQKELAPDSYWEQPNHLRVFERQSFHDLVTKAGLTVEQHFFRSFYSAIYWSLFWAADQEYGDPEKPVLKYWRLTWDALLSCEQGQKVIKTLNQALPKSQVILARKAG